MISKRPHNADKENSLESYIKLHYDPQDDLNRVRLNLGFSLNAKPLFDYKVGTSEEETARVDSWYQSRLWEIAQEEQAFRQRLDAAKNSGAIDGDDYFRAFNGLSSLTSPFERARQEAREAYQKERK